MVSMSHPPFSIHFRCFGRKVQEDEKKRNTRPPNGVLCWSGYRRIIVDEGWEVGGWEKRGKGGLGGRRNGGRLERVWGVKGKGRNRTNMEEKKGWAYERKTDIFEFWEKGPHSSIIFLKLTGMNNDFPDRYFRKL